jgi:hypothetical protein
MQHHTLQANVRDMPDVGVTIAEDPTFETTRASQHYVSNHAYSMPLLSVQTQVLLITDPIQDGSTPYVPRHDQSRETKLQHLANALTAVVEQTNLSCDDCGKDCKDKAVLRSAPLST